MRINDPANTIAVIALAWMARGDTVKGVPKSKLKLYQTLNANGKWNCLNNPEIEIDPSKINDDYCDCPDGSDEPGTSACANGRFFCENAGFKSSYVPSFKVNDGICDYDLCCDGSDEWGTDVHCENRCKQMNKEYTKQKQETVDKLSKGLKIKQEYLKKVKEYDERMQLEINDRSQIISQMNNEAYALKQKIDELNLKYNKEAMEFLQKLKSEHEVGKLDETVYTLAQNIETIKKGVLKNNERLAFGIQVLTNLKNDFDHNVNDIAVKNQLKAFDKFKSEKQYNDYENLFNDYLREYDAMYKDIQLYNENFWLEHNKEHLSNWKNFIWSRKSLLHTTLLKFLLIHDSASKEIEEMLTDIKENYNPNFNNDVVKKALKEIEEYFEFKQTAQDEILSNIDYSKQYNDHINNMIEQFEEFERKIGRTPTPVKDLRIDGRTEAEIEKLREEKKLEQEKETSREKGFLEKLHNNYEQLIEQFLGIDDMKKEVVDEVFKVTPHDIIHNKIDQINDLSRGVENSGSGELKKLAQELKELQEEIVSSNDKVAELVKSMNDAKYGPDNILKAVQNEVYKRTIGEYEYKIGFLSDITQSGNNNVAFIGSYANDIRTVDNKDGSKKLSLSFKNGAKCWSGPIREATVDVYCGASVEIVKVTEPEVCKYYIDMTSPIACFEEDLEKVEIADKVQHDEL